MTDTKHLARVIYSGKWLRKYNGSNIGIYCVYIGSTDKAVCILMILKFDLPDVYFVSIASIR